MRIVIDGITCEAAEHEFVKAVASRNNIAIPSLCHHSALPGLAACRLCVVEATPVGKSTQVVTSCVYPVSEGLEICTNSERLTQLRKTVLKLLISRAPKAEGRLAEYCQEYGVAGGFEPLDPEEQCILCGLCVKACNELGASAIATVMRGVEKQVQTAFDEAPEDCIGCASCAKVCPTGKIAWAEDDTSRVIWNKRFTLERCSICGKPFATAEELAWLARREVLQGVHGARPVLGSIGEVNRANPELGPSSKTGEASLETGFVCPRCRVREAATAAAGLIGQQ